jgi:bifunctional pyridoxal-dependent enzyme with beta-cystathionase and maltose regulon repressor activities
VLEKELSDKFSKAGVIMATGAMYHAERPGCFRLIFSVESEMLEEGFKS